MIDEMDADAREESFFKKNKKEIKLISIMGAFLILFLLSFYMEKSFSNNENISSSSVNKFINLKMIDDEKRKQKEQNFLKERKSTPKKNQLGRNTYNFRISGNVEGSNIVNGNVDNFREYDELEENISFENFENHVNELNKLKKTI
ncbi:hypothetical protein ACTFIZ_008853 [Dictyostelium cf. discoideum]